MRNTGRENRNYAKRRNYWLLRILRAAGILMAATGIIFFCLFLADRYFRTHITLRGIQNAWKSRDYQTVYDDGRQFLQKHPFNNSALTYSGYAGFFLAVSQNDTYQAQNYLDSSINSMRAALYGASEQLRPQLEYMLGKAYFYKNTISSYYYADLAVKYLELSRQHGYSAEDTAEYLGLSYAALGMTMESISAFTEALLVRESDSLLLSIAEQYYRAGEFSAAKQYLYRINSSTSNDEIMLKSRYLLGTICCDEGDYDGAMSEFNEVLRKDKNSADAHYGIGVIYEKQGNIVRARSEWRQALRIQANHPGALKKISDN